MLKMNGIAPCQNIESGQIELFKLIREKYRNRSEYHRDIDKALEIVLGRSNDSSREGFVPNQNGILKLKHPHGI